MLLLVAITTGHLCAPYPVSNDESFSYSSVFVCHKCLFARGQQQLYLISWYSQQEFIIK